MRKKRLTIKDKEIRVAIKNGDPKIARRNFLELLRRAAQTTLSS